MAESTSSTNYIHDMCWWCNAPVDFTADDHVTVRMEKVIIEHIARTRLEKRTTKTKSFIIPRCATCKVLQKRQSLPPILAGFGVVVGGSFGCYLGYLIQGEQGWLSWVIAGAIVAVSFSLGVGYTIRFSSRHPNQNKQIADFPPVKILLDQGWKIT